MFLEVHQLYDAFFNKNWNFDLEQNEYLVNVFEISGLRKDFWLYGYEMNELQIDDEIILAIMDSSSLLQYKQDSIDNLMTKIQTEAYHNQIIYALDMLMSKDTIISNYLEARNMAGNLSVELLINGLLYAPDNYDYNNTLMKIILIDEIYSGMIYESVKY
jgi:hypothetical protein